MIPISSITLSYAGMWHCCTLLHRLQCVKRHNNATAVILESSLKPLTLEVASVFIVFVLT